MEPPAGAPRERGRRDPASFRDPSGFVFRRDGRILRQVNRCYRKEYETVVESGLFETLQDQGRLLGHEEVSLELRCSDEAALVLAPRPVPFLSYPYEWCFSQLRDAALLTLRIQREALRHGMTLKDASAYNVQFLGSRPVFIDTLSFETYEEGRPWTGYRQFCEHFLAPLSLMAHVDVRLGQLSRRFVDGLPLDLAGQLLPLRTYLSPGLLVHLHLHARQQAKWRHREEDVASGGSVSRRGLGGILDNLTATIRKMEWKGEGETEWEGYYAEEGNNYTHRALADKDRAVARILEKLEPKTVGDLGGNTGRFSEIAARTADWVVCIDGDPGAVERAYREFAGRGDILPLWIDLENPSPGIGWCGRERPGVLARGPFDTVLALALVHHLVLGSNVPFPEVVSLLAAAGRTALVELPSREDSQVRRLLARRDDEVAARYDQAHFLTAVREHFEIVDAHPIEDSRRTLFALVGR